MRGSQSGNIQVQSLLPRWPPDFLDVSSLSLFSMAIGNKFGAKNDFQR